MSPILKSILVPKVSSTFGAHMGRQSKSHYVNKQGDIIHLEVLEDAVPFNLVKTDLDNQGYDAGGAYWGLRPKGLSLYGYVGPTDDILGYVDAKDREHAKSIIRQDHPHAKFFR